MARPLCRARPIGFAAVIVLLGLGGCVYERPGYGGYGGYGDGGRQYYGGGQYYGNGGGQYDGNGYGNGDGYRYRDFGYGNRPYGYRDYQPRYGYPYRYQHRRHRNDYCDYNPCAWDDDDD